MHMNLVFRILPQYESGFENAAKMPAHEVGFEKIAIIPAKYKNKIFKPLLTIFRSGLEGLGVSGFS